MYNRFFGFKERPFKLVPNPEYLFLSRVHEEVLAHLNYAVGYGEGFVAITGEVGTGKTTLCRMFLESLDEQTEAAYIFNPKLDALQLLKAINDEFGIPSDTESVKILIDRLNTFLMEMKAQGRRVILLVDEAQNLSADVLEQLRLLSNLETTTSKLLQIILVGQPELGVLLESDALRQLNQRITLSCHLVPLTLTETGDYIRHRLHIASRKPGVVFSAPALKSIFKYSGGVPRLINIACDRALLTAFTLGKYRITHDIAKQAIRELDGKRSRRRLPMPIWGKTIIGLVAALAILAAGVVGGRNLIKRSPSEPVEPLALQQAVTPAPSSGTPDTSAAAEAPALVIRDLPSPPQPMSPEPGPASAPEPAPGPAPPTVAETEAANAIEPPQPAVIDLEQALASLNAMDSRGGALKAVLAAWRVPPPQPYAPVDALDDDLFFRISMRHSGLETIRVKGNFNLIRKLNVPAILEFPRLDGGASRYMAVVGLMGDEIGLAVGDSRYALPTSSLAGLWNGVAHIIWKNHYNYEGVIPTSSPGEAILALKMHLKALGFPIAEMTAAYDTTTRMAVEVIQARHGLDVDGRVGPLTKIVLYNDDRSLTIPRLADAGKG